MDKQNAVYPYNGLLFSHRRNEVLTHGETLKTLGEVKEADHKDHRLYNSIHLNGPVQKRQIHRERKAVSGYQGLGRGRMGSGCKGCGVSFG